MNLADISKMPSSIQAQVAAQLGQSKPIPEPVSAPEPSAPKSARKSRPSPVETPPRAAESHIRAMQVLDQELRNLLNIPEPSALDQTPVHIPAALLRHILENWGSAYHVCANETQRRRVVDNAIKSLAQTA